MDTDLDQLIEDYLDGTLPPEQIDWFERNLIRPEIATAFAQGLALRELLKTAQPSQPPDGLVNRICDVVITNRPKSAKERRWFQKTRPALSAMAWAVRGPALAFAGRPTGTRETLSGLGTIRYTLGPLANRTSAGAGSGTQKRSSWWKRALRLGR